MLLPGGFAVVSPLAHGTSVLSLTLRVSLLVFFNKVSGSKCFPAMLAFKGFLLGVNTFVLLEVRHRKTFARTEPA